MSLPPASNLARALGYFAPLPPIYDTDVERELELAILGHIFAWRDPDVLLWRPALREGEQCRNAQAPDFAEHRALFRSRPQCLRCDASARVTLEQPYCATCLRQICYTYGKARSKQDKVSVPQEEFQAAEEKLRWISQLPVLIWNVNTILPDCVVCGRLTDHDRYPPVSSPAGGVAPLCLPCLLAWSPGLTAEYMAEGQARRKKDEEQESERLRMMEASVFADDRLCLDKLGEVRYTDKYIALKKARALAYHEKMIDQTNRRARGEHIYREGYDIEEVEAGLTVYAPTPKYTAWPWPPDWVSPPLPWPGGKVPAHPPLAGYSS